MMFDIYRTYYKMLGEPFRLGPDHRFSLAHASYANARAYLQYAIFQGEGFIAVTGRAGTGKTTLISDLLDGLDRERIEAVTLTSTQLESRDLLQMVVNLFGLCPEDNSKPGLLQELERYLRQQNHRGRRVVLIVDEAQGLSVSALEELRLMANLQHNYQLLLQIFLVGQEQLLEKLRAPGMEHLQQRLIAASHLQPLALDEFIDYVEHRLSLVGWKGDPGIEEGALRLIHRFSGGIPRRINLICNRLFLYGGLGQKHLLNAEDARQVVAELQNEFLLPPDPEDCEERAEVDECTDPPACSLPRKDMSAAPVLDMRRKSARSAVGEREPSERGTHSRVDHHSKRTEATLRRDPCVDTGRPEPVPDYAAGKRYLEKFALLTLLAGFALVALYAQSDIGTPGLLRGRDEAKPRVASGAPPQTTATFRGLVQREVSEPVSVEVTAGAAGSIVDRKHAEAAIEIAGVKAPAVKVLSDIAEENAGPSRVVHPR